MIRNTLGVMKMHDGSQQTAGVAARREPRTAVLVSSKELQSLGVTSDPPPIWPFKLGLVLEVVCVCVWREGRCP